MKTFTFLKRDLGIRGVLCVEALAFGGFFAAPWLGVKYVSLCLFCAVLVTAAKSGTAQRLLLSGIGVLVFAAAFVLTPVFVINPLAELFPHPPSPTVSLVLKLFTLAGLTILGAVWTLLTFRIPNTWPSAGKRRSLLPLVLLPIALFIVYYPSWIQGLAFAGDESYHSLSIFMNQLLLYNIVRTGWGIAALFLWVCAAFVIPLARRRKLTELLVAWIMAGFIILALQPMWYSPDLVGQSFILDRVGRFPSAQPWISAFLGCLTLQSWLDMLILPMEIMRLLPMLALAALGFLWTLDHRWRKRNPLITMAFALPLLTIPNLLYHGTIVYLELPAVFLACVCLADAKRLITTPYPKVCGRWSWWALVFLGFTKETAFPMLLVVAAARVAALVKSLVNRPRNSPEFHPLKSSLNELAALFCVLGPAGLYAALRFILGARPYGANFGNLTIPRLWLEFGVNLLRQNGLLLAIAATGAVILIKAKRRVGLALSVAFLLVMSAFLICDDPKYVGLARFNVLLLPPILHLAWEAFTFLTAKSLTVGLLLVAGVLASNIALSPLDLQGRRAVWGKSDERWYHFEECFDAILERNPTAKVLLGNMPANYCTSIPGNRRRWKLNCRQIDLPSNDQRAEILATLEHAADKKFDFMIHRLNASTSVTIELPPGWRLLQLFPARHGGLALFQNLQQCATNIHRDERRKEKRSEARGIAESTITPYPRQK